LLSPEAAVVVADLATGERTTLAGGERVVNNWPRWHPNGEWIYYMSDRGGEHPNLWQVRPDGSGMERLVEAPNDLVWPAVSPGGGRVAFTRNHDNELQVCVYENGNVRQLTDARGTHTELAWIDDEHLVCVYQSPLAPPPSDPRASTGR